MCKEKYSSKFPFTSSKVVEYKYLVPYLPLLTSTNRYEQCGESYCKAITNHAVAQKQHNIHY